MKSQTSDLMKSYGKRNYSQKTAEASEHLLVWCLTKRGVYAQKVSMTGFDVFAVDPNGDVFDKHATALISVKAVGGNTCGRTIKIEDMETIAEEMWMQPRFLYIAVGFFKPEDIRSISYYLVPLKEAKNHLTTKKTGEVTFRITKSEAENLVKERKAIKI